jgi:spore coat polysaccharide biosynthesis protein SpsF (cytidylyltransferase family)
MHNNDEIYEYSIRAETKLEHIRLTVDYPGDFRIIKILIDEFDCHKKSFEEIVPVYQNEFLES